MDHQGVASTEREPEVEELYPLGPVLDLLQEWWALNHALERVSRSMSSRLGVTAPQRMVLRVIGRYPGINPGQLARLLHLDPSTVSSALRRLEARGVLRRRQTGSDRRQVSLGLTARGRALDVDDDQTIEGALSRVVARTPPQDLAAVRAFLFAFVEALDHVRVTNSEPPPDGG